MPLENTSDIQFGAICMRLSGGRRLIEILIHIRPSGKKIYLSRTWSLTFIPQILFTFAYIPVKYKDIPYYLYISLKYAASVVWGNRPIMRLTNHFPDSYILTMWGEWSCWSCLSLNSGKPIGDIAGWLLAGANTLWSWPNIQGENTCWINVKGPLSSVSCEQMNGVGALVVSNQYPTFSWHRRGRRQTSAPTLLAHVTSVTILSGK